MTTQPAELDPIAAPHEKGGTDAYPVSPDSPPFYKADPVSLMQENNVGHLLRQVQSSINRRMDQHVLPLGLTAMQWRPLALLRYRQINTSAELARHTHVDTGAMTRTLDRLEAKGFIRRQRCSDDRRVVLLELTESGNTAVELILPGVAETLNTHISGFSTDEVKTLISLLHRMLANGATATSPETR